MYCSRTLTPSGGRAEQLRGGALGAMPRTKKVLSRAEAKAMALRDGVEQVVLTQDVDDMQRVANERRTGSMLVSALRRPTKALWRMVVALGSPDHPVRGFQFEKNQLLHGRIEFETNMAAPIVVF